jgi:hypothetical protein
VSEQAEWQMPNDELRMTNGEGQMPNDENWEEEEGPAVAAGWAAGKGGASGGE